MRTSARILLLVAVVVHVAFAVSLVHPGHFLNPLFPEGMHNIGDGQGSDFFAFYQAGTYVLEGSDIYQRPMDDAERTVPYAYFYRYLPFVAYTLGVAANAVSPWVAYWIWTAIVELALIGCILLTRRLARDSSLFALLASMWLLYTPFYIEQYMGQLNLLMAAGIFLMVLSYSEGKMKRFDWIWIATVITKHLTILYVPLMLRLKRYRTVLLVLVMLGVTAIPYLIMRVSGVGDFAHDNFSLTLYPYAGNFGALALLMVLKMRLFPIASSIGFNLGPLKITVTRALVLLVMMVPTLTALNITFRRRPFDLLESVALWTMVYFFVFREVWEYHYVLLLPLFVLLYAGTRARVLWYIYALAASPTLFVLYDVPARSPEVHWSALEHIVNHAFKVVPLVWLFMWVAAGCFRRHLNRAAGTDRELVGTT